MPRTAKTSTTKKKTTKKTAGRRKPKPTTNAKPKPAAKAKAKAKTEAKSTPKKKWSSRAVLRRIEAGASADCPRCEEPIHYKAREQANQVICNIYEKGAWQRVEQYHEACYKKAKNPYGKPENKVR